MAALLAAIAILGSCGTGSEPDPVATETELSETSLHTINADTQCDREPEENGPTVLLLHGAAYRAETWVESATLQALCEAGVPAVAVDLPGFGLSPSSDQAPEELMADLTGEIGTPVVVVSPSMSGRYGLAWLTGNPDEAAGFVAVAPVGIEAWETPDGFDVPTIGIWGEADAVVPVERGEQFIAQIDGAELQVIAGGDHAVYQSHPDDFNEQLLTFVEGL